MNGNVHPKGKRLNVIIYQNDHLGTPQKMTAVNGAVVWSGSYSSFGEAAVDASSTITNNLRFPGQYFDSETGLHYNWHRYYDPRTGRYLTPDPIGIMNGTNHLYVYARNNSIRMIDPNGLYGKDIHVGWTESLAIGEGFSDCAAKEMAGANQGVDDNSETGPFAGVTARRLWHFPSQQRVDGLLNLAYTSCDLSALGRALHVMQDSYSHAGYGPVLGHAAAGTAPDDMRRNFDKTFSMLKQTQDVLRQFLAKCGEEAKKCCEK